MYRKKSFAAYKEHLRRRYQDMIEKSENYKYEDESLSDIAAYKAMKLLQKIEQVNYLDNKKKPA